MLSLLVVGLLCISAATSAGGDVIDLASVGQWTLSGGQHDQLEVTVPGSVYTDLQQAGVLTGDLLYRFNDVEYRWVALTNWTYRLTFPLTQEQVDKTSVILDCHGLDTVASVYINNVLVGNSNNMFVRY